MIEDLLEDVLVDLVCWPAGQSLSAHVEADVFEPNTMAVLKAELADPEVQALVARAATPEWSSRFDTPRLYARVSELVRGSTEKHDRLLTSKFNRSSARAKLNTQDAKDIRAAALAKYDRLMSARNMPPKEVLQLGWSDDKSTRDRVRRWVKERAKGA